MARVHDLIAKRRQASVTPPKKSAVTNLAAVGRRVTLRPGAVPVNRPQAVKHLADVGQRVMVEEDALPHHDGAVFEIVKVRGLGDDAFAQLRTQDGRVLKQWARATDLRPAPPERLVTPASMSPEGEVMKDTIALSTQFDGRVRVLSAEHGFADAVKLAARELPEAAAAWRASGMERVEEAAPTPPQPISLRARAGETFDTLCQRHARETGLSLRAAIHAVSMAHPELAAAR